MLSLTIVSLKHGSFCEVGWMTWYVPPMLTSQMRRFTEGMSYERYMQLYTATYNYCIYTGYSGSIGSATGAQLVGGELHNCVSTYFQQHAQELYAKLGGLAGEELLRSYAEEWERYTTGANFVNRLLVYLNRHWVKHEREEGHTDVFTVYTLALKQWKLHVFDLIQRDNALINAVMDQIERQRRGDMVSTTQLKSILNSCVSLGIDETDLLRQNLDVYQQVFQGVFLEATSAFYRTESANSLAHHSVTEYMKEAESRLEEEENRVELYMHESTRVPLLELCRSELITAHREVLWNEFEKLLVNDMVDDLARTYKLLAQVQHGLDPLRQRFEAYFISRGLDSIGREMDGNLEVADPATYVSAIIRVHQDGDRMIAKAFQSDSGFHASLDKACRSYINKNQLTSISPSRGPELLAKFVDGVLKKNTRNTDETSIEESLDHAMTVFKYIEDRDYFQKFYIKFLSKRIVSFSTVSMDAEESMIARLKEACGFEYTSRIQRMFTEASLTKELNDRFHDWRSQQHFDTGMPFYAFVLTSGIWPLQTIATDFIVPAELKQTYQDFMEFYQRAHAHRQLSWLWHLSTNEIRATFDSRKYIFTTSTYQAAILLLFNTQSVLTYDEIAAATGLDKNALNAALFPMTKFKLLLQLDDSYSLNTDFKAKKVRVNLHVPVRSEQKAESAEVAQTVHEDRKMLIQAVIVRIMKARKTYRHNLLLNEVIMQLQSRFQPKVPDIKKAIDTLIEKEYLQRVENEKDVYSYVA